jgi:hypothetical protein
MQSLDRRSTREARTCVDSALCVREGINAGAWQEPSVFLLAVALYGQQSPDLIVLYRAYRRKKLATLNARRPKDSAAGLAASMGKRQDARTQKVDESGANFGGCTSKS